MKLEPCPFCGSRDIKISFKRVAQFSFCYYQVAMYCNDCRTYGPRILTETVDKRLSGRQKIVSDNVYKERASKVWNDRCVALPNEPLQVVTCEDCKYHCDIGQHYCKKIKILCPDDCGFYCKYGSKKES